MNAETNMMGVKNINIQVQGSYPVISAYEFEFMKELPEIQGLWKESTLYLIVQRPLLYFNKLRIEEGIIKFEISDMRGNPPLSGSLDPYAAGFAKEGEGFLFSASLYKGDATGLKSFDYAAGFFIETKTREHLASITPQKVIHLSALKCVGYSLTGNLCDYIDYHVHYIGQSFDQDIWSRLTGHEKMQSILTRESILDSASNRNSFEIALILLEVVGFSEANMAPFHSRMLNTNASPILHDLGDDDDIDAYIEFNKSKISFSDPELTNEVEAMLINRFQPEYNKIKFKKYPNIARGTRSKGYTESSLVVERNPTTLKTNDFTLGAIFI